MPYNPNQEEMPYNPNQQAHEKEPWLAVNLSTLWPGLGQFYAGYKGWGQFLAFIQFLLLALITFSLIVDTVPIFYLFISIISLLILRICNLFNAYSCAKRFNSPSFTKFRTSSKDPWLAVFLNSFPIPIGHFYLGKISKGLLLIFINVLTLTPLFVLTLVDVTDRVLVVKQNWLSALILSIFTSLIWSYFMAVQTYRDSPQNRRISTNGIERFLLAFTVMMPTFVILPCLYKSIVEARYIPSGSMLPTVQINDRLIIDKLSYQFSNPQRGDIIVFNATKELEKQELKGTFINRVIGLPGDRVEVKASKVYINDKVLSEKYLNEAPKYNWKSNELTPDGIIPENHYVVLADNRNNSYDSHYWGFVPKEKIIGRVSKRFWPLSRAGEIDPKPDYNNPQPN
jgi:signal peptidase I